ncbi:hypothetical protein [Methylocapsa acidiphila]|uniref:hypothetical protein n=1 Tax=Methylocapsa acidiphila TaxID=133552 RepID=UPI0012EB97B3|nr:hypothetical protein [Methylocapsa acidiphila]
MPIQSSLPVQRETQATAGGETPRAASFARRPRGLVAYKGRPAAKPASPPAEKAAPAKESQPQAPAAPKPSEPAKEGGAKGSRN